MRKYSHPARFLSSGTLGGKEKGGEGRGEEVKITENEAEEACSKTNYFIVVGINDEKYKALFELGAMLSLAGMWITERFRSRLRDSDVTI